MGDADHTSDTRIQTGSGTVRGQEEHGIRRWLGIPYALPPFGERRFAPPQPAAPWGNELDARSYGPTSPQAPYRGEIGELLSVTRIDGENILTVNVWAPADAHGAPVVLWLHGGAPERGSSAQPGYAGDTFARDGIVFVSANYRLGAEGFSVLPDAPRNLGLSDAALALQWVHREIAAFGGDASRITLMGESAGGALVAALLTQPQSRSLVAGAIIQSGPLGGSPGYAPALDPDTLPRSPVDALPDVDIPLLIGTNTDEYRLWLSPTALSRIGAAKAWIARRALRIPERAARAVRRDNPDATPGEALGQLLTDTILRAPASRVARARTAPTYVYEFAWPSPVRDLRAAHAVEIAFAFDRVDSPDALPLNGPDAPRELAHDMHAAWVAFIRDGNPGWTEYGPERVTRVGRRVGDGAAAACGGC